MIKNYFKSSHLKNRLLSIVCLSILSWSFLLSPVQAQALTDRPTGTIQPYLDRVSDRVNEFTLDNGMKFIVLEDDKAPVVSFVTYINAGGVDETIGKTGAAHFLEHLAFKGTTTIGTTDYEAEKQLLERLEALAAEIKAARSAGEEEKALQLQAEFAETEAAAAEYINQNEFGQIVDREGGVGLNAATSADYTIYFYSFPANKVELWMALESERFFDPVFRRDFYKEQEVILEERRLRTDNSPIGKMIEEFLDTSFTSHPYRQPVIGYEEDIRNLTPQDISDFFKTYYPPSNITVAVVGDVNTENFKELAEAYFGRYESSEHPPQVAIVEPPQTAEREITLNLASQPWYLEGYHRPGLDHPDHVVYDIISRLLSDGRTSRLYKSLVQEKQVALSAQGFSGFPGDRYPNLVLLYALTAPERSVDEVATALGAEITRIKTEPVSAQELERVKTQAKAELLRSLNSNMGMARLFAEYEAKTGSWRTLFSQLTALEAVTAEDVQRVAQKTFTTENRTIGRILPLETEATN